MNVYIERLAFIEHFEGRNAKYNFR